MSERKNVTLDDIGRRLSIENKNAYYGWVRHVVTLSAGALTLLVSLQSNFIPESFLLLLILKLSFVALGLSAGLGLFVLHGEHQNLLDAHNKLRKVRETQGDEAAARMAQQGHRPRKMYGVTYRWMIRSMAVGFLLLVLFGVVNSPHG